MKNSTQIGIAFALVTSLVAAIFAPGIVSALEDKYHSLYVTGPRAPDGGTAALQVAIPKTAPVAESALCHLSECLYVSAGQDAGVVYPTPNAWYRMKVISTSGEGCWANGAAPADCTTAPRFEPSDKDYVAFPPTTWDPDLDAGVYSYTAGDVGNWGPNLDAGQYVAPIYVAASSATAVAVQFCPVQTCTPDGGW